VSVKPNQETVKRKLRGTLGPAGKRMKTLAIEHCADQLAATVFRPY
jgi:hypothetical protein